MKVTVTPPIDRTVTIEMLESEAVLLKQVIGGLSRERIAEAMELTFGNQLTIDAGLMVNRLYAALDDAFGTQIAVNDSD